MRRAISIAILGVLFLIKNSSAYEVQTHQDISLAAADQSSLGINQEVLNRLGLRFSINDDNSEQMFANSKGEKQKIRELIRSGSVFEDDPPGPIYHFFDPRTNSPLYLRPADYPAAWIVYVNLINISSATSPDWAVLGQAPANTNNYSFLKARDYFYRGMTSPINQERQSNLVLLFESLYTSSSLFFF
jgi:hypothetical protein